VSSSSAAKRPPARGLGSGGIWRAWSERNYRYYATGSGLSMIGMWTQRLTIGWLTWHLTESGSWLGIIAFADIAPALALLPLTGAVADRVDRLRMLKFTQVLSSLFATALALMSYADLLTVHWLLLFTLVQGTVTAFNQPVRLALVPNLVKKENMAPAIAIHSMLFNVARFIGPMLSWWLIVVEGPSFSLAIPAASYVLYSVLLSFIRLVQPDDVVVRRPLRDIPAEIFDGFRYSLRHEGIGTLLVLTLVMGVFGRNYTELLPGFAAQVFGRGVEGLGMMTSAIGGGAILAGLWLSNRGRVKGLLNIGIVCMAALIAMIAVFAVTPVFWIALACLALAGFFMSSVGISQQILVQAAVESQMRGRVLGVYGLLSRGGPSIGALFMGVLSEHYGFQAPVAAGAAVCLFFWLWLYLRRNPIRQSLEGAA
jgi:MFS family permease